MNTNIIRTIALKDLKEVSQNRYALITATVVPLIFVVIMPLFFILLPTVFNVPLDTMNSGRNPMTMVLQNVPALAAAFAGMTQLQAWVVFMTGSLMAPFFLIIPLLFSTIVGAESFAGEKERKTLEALIYTPATDAELFVGKVAAAVVPAVLVAWLCFVVYGVVVNAAGWPVMGRVWFPTLQWWPLMLWVTPGLATLGVSLTVLISSRVSTFMEAYQMSASLVLLVLVLLAGQLTGVLYLSVGVSLLAGLAIWVVSAVSLWFAIRTFSRTAILAKL
jgi:ABC-type Na+ efflux pump permease subunit